MDWNRTNHMDTSPSSASWRCSLKLQFDRLGASVVGSPVVVVAEAEAEWPPWSPCVGEEALFPQSPPSWPFEGGPQRQETEGPFSVRPPSATLECPRPAPRRGRVVRGRAADSREFEVVVASVSRPNHHALSAPSQRAGTCEPHHVLERRALCMPTPSPSPNCRWNPHPRPVTVHLPRDRSGHRDEPFHDQREIRVREQFNRTTPAWFAAKWFKQKTFFIAD